MRQAVVRRERSDVRQLGLIGPQKLLARRDVVEQIPYRDGSPCRPRKLIAADHLAASNFNRGAGTLFGRARLKHEARHRRDGRQRFAAESKRGDRKQIFDVAELAGSVTLESQQGIVAQHAAAVIGDTDQAAAAALDINPEIGGSCIERVFEQLFDHRRRPLNHLSSRNFVGDVVGENADSAHGQ